MLLITFQIFSEWLIFGRESVLNEILRIGLLDVRSKIN